MSQIKEAIELLEKALDWCQRAPDGIPVGILLSLDQALAKLRTEQPPAGEFTKKVREDWDKNIFGGVIFDLCYRLDRSEVEIKRINAGWAMESQLRENLLQENFKYEMKIKELEAAIAKAKEGGE